VAIPALLIAIAYCLIAALCFFLMRAVVQRVTEASVRVEDAVVGSIGRGLLVLLGIGRNDIIASADYTIEKLLGLRIFDDQSGKMNLSVGQVGGAVLVVSQFTLFGDVRRGKRPSFDDAAPPEQARALYEYVVEKIREQGVECSTGEFQAMMYVSLVNDGPVTVLIDSEKVF
jgi:D-aminoacyl-tRNA deacylase